MASLFVKSLSNLIVIFILPFLGYFSTSPVIANQGISKGDVVISEISWGGTSLNKTTAPTFYDEWIELYNTTDKEIILNNFVIYGIGGGNSGIPLQGTLQPNSFFLITKIQTPDLRSAIRVTSDFTTNKLSISNSGFDISLKSGDMEVDRVSSPGKPFAGKSTEGIRSSMAKVDLKSDGSLTESWKDSVNRVNFHNKSSNPNIACEVDLGTPKSENFPDKEDLKVIEFEEICFTEGKVTELNNKTYLSFPEPLRAQELFRTSVELPTQPHAYKITLYLDLNTNESPQTSLGELTVNFNNGDQFNLKDISTTQIVSNKKIEFEITKAENITSADLIFKANGSNTPLILDSIKIEALKETVKEKEILGINLNSEFGINKFDDTLGKEVKFLGKDKSNNKRADIKDSYFADFINLSDEEIFECIYTLKFSNIDETSDKNEVFAELYFKNGLTQSEDLKQIRLSEIKENTYQDFSLNIITEKYGNYSFDLKSFNKADISLHKIYLKQHKSTKTEIIKALDLQTTKEQVFNAEESDLILGNNSNIPIKTLDYKPKYHCLNMKLCEIEFDIRKINTKNSNVGNIYLYSIDSKGNKHIEIERIKADRDKDSQSIKLNINAQENTKLGFKIFLNPGTQISLKDINIRPKDNEEKLIKYKSILKNGWADLVRFKANLDDRGYKGSISDILTTEKLSEGEYIAKFNLKIRGKLPSSNSILSVNAFDEYGRKLFEKELKENDLSLFKETEIAEDFNITASSKVFIRIKFYGSSKDAYSDIEVGNIKINKI